MTTHLIVVCYTCGVAWDMDYQPDPCTCDIQGGMIDLSEIIPTETDDWEAAVAEQQARLDAARVDHPRGGG